MLTLYFEVEERREPAGYGKEYCTDIVLGGGREEGELTWHGGEYCTDLVLGGGGEEGERPLYG